MRFGSRVSRSSATVAPFAASHCVSAPPMTTLTPALVSASFTPWMRASSAGTPRTPSIRPMESPGLSTVLR